MPPPVSAEDWSALVTRLNETFHEAQRRSGVKVPKDIVRGYKADRKLRAFVEGQEPIGIWSTWERVANWFSFWMESHAIKKLQFPSSVFIREAAEFRSQLEDWEAANPEARWREFPLEPTKPNLDDSNVQAVADFVYAVTNVTATKPLLKSIWTALQTHNNDAAMVTSAFEYAFSNDSYSGGRDVRTRVLGFFEGDHIETALVNRQRVEEAERTRVANQTKLDLQLKNQRELKVKQESERKQEREAQQAQQATVREAEVRWLTEWRSICETEADVEEWLLKHPAPSELMHHSNRVADVLRDGRQVHQKRMQRIAAEVTAIAEAAADAERQRQAAEEDEAFKLPIALEFLKTILQDGVHLVGDLQTTANSLGVDARVLQDAADLLGVVEQLGTAEMTLFGIDQKKEWELPQEIGVNS